MRVAALAIVFVACTAPETTDAGATDATATDSPIDASPDASIACATLTPEQAGSSGVAGWIGPSFASHLTFDASHYDSVFTGVGARDDLVPSSVDAIDATHVELHALIASDYASCDTPDGRIIDCSTSPAAALATYVIRLDDVLPLATLVRAEPMPLDDARTQLMAVPSHQGDHPLCTGAGDWDVWSAPSSVHAGPAGAECYEYLPPALPSVLLRHRVSGRSWAVSLPVLPSVCADGWAGTGAGADCTPSMGYANGATGAHTLTFVGTLVEPPASGPSPPYSCALQAMCLGTCPGCWASPYTEGVCVSDVDADWMRAVCTAPDIDAIPIPSTTFECRRACASIHCSGATL